MTTERERTMLERLTFFSDAVFAIAITLLVIEVQLPPVHPVSEEALGQALVDLLPNYIGFLSSFLVIGRFWISHHELFGMLKASDHRLIWANLFLLLAIAFMPFPTAVFSEHVQLRVGVGLYGAWLTLIGMLNRRLARMALGNPLLVRDDIDAATIAGKLHGTWTAILIGATAFVAGMIHPLLALIALAIGGPLYGWLFRRQAPRAEVMPG